MRSQILILVLGGFLISETVQNELDDAKKFLEEYNTRVQEISYQGGLKAWAYNTNITDYNAEQMVAYDLISANFSKAASANASQFNTTSFPAREKRMLDDIAEQGTSAMKDPDKLQRLSKVLSTMEGIYSKGKVCGVPPDFECLQLEPGLTRILASDRDYDTLSYVWDEWRDVSKGQMDNLYQEFVELSNEGIRDAGKYNDTGAYWRSWYEDPDFETELQGLLEELNPLYQNLHAYVKRKLKTVYPKDKFPAGGHIPAHLLGNMWAQSWINLYDIVEPYPGKESIDITPVLKERNYTALMMFRVAEGFFTSLGLKEMPQEFWDNSMITKPTDGREVVCHASAWDFSHGNDVRIKMCTDITMDDLVTIHHEMGHIQYYLQYQDQPSVFRGGANPGFHEAIGDVMALSASTPKHLHAIGLLDKVEDDDEADINFLMRQALDKVSFLPFGYLIDQWRWSVFRGDTKPAQYNDKWWDLRCKFQGLSPPVKRTAADFDPGAKYHIPANTPYIRYFVSFVIQFQMHKALCVSAGHVGPLYKCDIYNSTAAGDQLRAVLKAGSSQPWEDTLKNLTGSSKMSTRPLKEYFQPLIDWLKKENQGENITWNETCADIEEDVSELKFLDDYNTQATDMMFRLTSAQWNYGANITDYNQAVMVNRSLEKADFDKAMAKKANYFPWKNFTDSGVVRQFKMITNIGTSALEDKDQIKKMVDLQAHIEGIYGKATVTMSDGKTLLLEPGLTEIMTSSRNFTELREAWVRWRDVTGKLMKDDYAEFVNISNNAVKQLDYADTGDYWRAVYETPTFEDDLKGLLDQLKPLYELLHAYVRKQLKAEYGTENFPTTGQIPAHLLGNMWGQQWNNIYDLVEPYPGVAKIDVTTEMINQDVYVATVHYCFCHWIYVVVGTGNMWGQHWNNIYDLVEPYPGVAQIDVTGEMQKQNFTVNQMFKKSEEFFTSLGLLSMPDEFWNGTVMVNPPGVQMVCHASAWDFYNQKDFRIKMCTEVNMEELVTIHHEMGHIQYFLQYKTQPVVFRNGANPGFHEAIGDVMALSVSTPKHLHTINLLKTQESSKESDINFLMKMALEKIAFLPFGYLIDQWRWSVFSGETSPDKYNDKWWDLRCKYQGLAPPVERTAEDFDPGAKYHIPANVPYIRYFVSFVVQFQFHKALCDEAGETGETGPLYKCDIYNSKAAGAKLRDMLKLGSSKPWTEAMMGLTGTTKMDVQPLMEYFKPLTDWLKEQVGSDHGWSDECSHVTEGEKLRDWLVEYERDMSQMYYKSSEADWAYNTNISDANAEKRTEVTLELSAMKKEVARNVATYHWQEYKDPQLKRRLRMMADIGTSALKNETMLKKMEETKEAMESIYSKAKVCLSSPDRCYKLDPGLTQLFAESRNHSDLLTAWRLWRDETGKKMPDHYAKLVEISNAAVGELGYADTGAYWRSTYETATFQSDLEDLLDQLKPLYENLHTYVRRKLMQQYGEDIFPESGHIPAHLLGNMWGQQWNNIYDLVIPYKSKQAIDVSTELKNKHYNVTQLFKTAEHFFMSLGMFPMEEKFWQKSMLVRPEGREVVCHASAWDFSAGDDFRIKMCTKINMEDLITIHHEMGHTEYQMAYKDQPVPFRDGANAGFHEAIGDVMSLSVSTPKHLRKIGLLAQGTDDEESEINFLMSMALEKIAFLPFGYLIDQWRWSVFSEETPREKYNDKWWELRCKYQGVAPPVARGPDDFDPGAKFHIPSNYPYIRYFVSYVIQFQFHKALCEAANQTGPLHRCDIYQSKAAGDKLKQMLSMGASRPWPEAMQVLTGQTKMDVGPIIEYFRPLIDWLETENYRERPGWSPACPSPEDHPKHQTNPPVMIHPSKHGKSTDGAPTTGCASLVAVCLVSLIAMMVPSL